MPESRRTSLPLFCPRFQPAKGAGGGGGGKYVGVLRPVNQYDYIGGGVR